MYVYIYIYIYTSYHIWNIKFHKSNVKNHMSNTVLHIMCIFRRTDDNEWKAFPLVAAYNWKTMVQHPCFCRGHAGYRQTNYRFLLLHWWFGATMSKNILQLKTLPKYFVRSSLCYYSTSCWQRSHKVQRENAWISPNSRPFHACFPTRCCFWAPCKINTLVSDRKVLYTVIEFCNSCSSRKTWSFFNFDMSFVDFRILSLRSAISRARWQPSESNREYRFWFPASAAILFLSSVWFKSSTFSAVSAWFRFKSNPFWSKHSSNASCSLWVLTPKR